MINHSASEWVDLLSHLGAASRSEANSIPLLIVSMQHWLVWIYANLDPEFLSQLVHGGVNHKCLYFILHHSFYNFLNSSIEHNTSTQASWLWTNAHVWCYYENIMRLKFQRFDVIKPLNWCCAAASRKSWWINRCPSTLFYICCVLHFFSPTQFSQDSIQLANQCRYWWVSDKNHYGNQL